MKATHRDDAFAYSIFDSAHGLDFNGWFFARADGNVLVDPVEMSEHDREHVRRLGGVAHVVITNSDHIRAAPALADVFGAKTWGPAAEREGFPVNCDQWLAQGERFVPGVEVLAFDGSKTPGELALVLDGDTLVTGDLIRGPWGGRLDLLPPAKLKNRMAAARGIAGLAARQGIVGVLVGDGWPVFRQGSEHLRELAARSLSEPGPG